MQGTMQDFRVRTDGRRDVVAAVRRRVEAASAKGDALWGAYVSLADEAAQACAAGRAGEDVALRGAAALAKREFWKSARRMVALQKALLLSMADRFERGAR